MDKQAILDLVAKKLAEQEWYYISFVSRCVCCPDEHSPLSDYEIDEFISNVSTAINEIEANNG